MTNTYNTGNPLGSTSAKDLYDNASNFDDAMGSLLPSFIDRFGRARETWSGMETLVSDFLQSMGFEPTHLVYVDGSPLTVLRPTQLIDRAGSVYKVKQPASFPAGLTGTWATDSLLLVDVGDASLRALLASSSGADYVGYGSRSLGSRNTGHRVMKDGGAAGNGISNDQSAIEAELASAFIKDERYLEAGNYLVTSRPSNNYGIDTPGPGAIVSTNGTSYTQYNTYANKNQIATGRNFLTRIDRVMAVTSRAVNVHLFGDSTIAGGFNYLTWPFFLQYMLPLMARYSGCSHPFNVVNHGVGGTTMAQMDALPYLSATSDLFIIGYGKNEGAGDRTTRLATFKNSMFNKLQEIRSATYGSTYETGILLVTPSSSDDPDNGRDSYWYEQIRGIFREAADKFQCALYDVYAESWDSKGADGQYMGPSSPSDPYNLVHPNDIGNARIWGRIMDWMVGGQQQYGQKTNNFINTGGVHAFADISLLPNQYNSGVTIERARFVDGWPEDGALVTTVQPDFICRQELFPFANNRSKQYMRNATTPGNYWNLWTGKRDLLILTNGWGAMGSGRGSPTARMTADGTVTLAGSMSGGTITAGVTAATLPAGLRPAFMITPVVATAAGTVRIRIFADGSIQGVDALNATETCLDGVSFQVSDT